MHPVLQSLWDLIVNLATLGRELFFLAAQWALLLVWVAWWLGAVNWKKCWPTLRDGAWVPLVLLTVVTAFVWSRIAPASSDFFGFMIVPNFWSHLLAVSLTVGLALFCGWLQGYLQWTPPEISVEPPAHGDDHGHEHAAAHH